MDMASRPGYVVATAYLALTAGVAAAFALAGMIGVMVMSALTYGATRLAFWRHIPSPALAPTFVAIALALMLVRAAAVHGGQSAGHVSPAPVTTAAVPIQPQPPDDRSWREAATVFEADHPVLRLGHNYQVMQAALERQPTGLGDAELLLRAYSQAQLDPAWVPADDRPPPPPGFAYEQ